MKFKLITFILLAFFIIKISYSKDPYKIEDFSVSDVIVVVNDKPITTKELFERLYKLNGQQVLDQMITEILILQEAEKQKIITTQEEINEEINKLKAQLGLDEEKFKEQFLKARNITEEDLKEIMKLELLSKKLILKDREIKVTEEEIRSYFELNKEMFATPEQVRIAHILVETEREAKDLLIALKAGAKFELLVQSKSLDAQSIAKAGDIGFISRGSTNLPELEEAAFQLKEIGQISDVVKTSLGYHVIKLLSRKPKEPAEFTDEIKEKIQQILLNQKIFSQLINYVNDLKKKAKIEFVKTQP